ncbi:MAG TPA: hypothetical protein VFW78_09415 [Bacteroidia bacterium]|nr:hypothetical protein [Bacteroidia bacterium]
MEFTEHALKRLDILIGNEKARREVYFMHQFLLPGRFSITWNRGIQLKDLGLFAERCDSFDVRILGMETHLDSPYPLFIFCWEDFKDKTNSWVSTVISELNAAAVHDFIIPTIDVHVSVLNKYLL